MTELTLGADPELIFVGPKGLVPAADYFERQDNHRGNNPEIGGDGHPATAEVRPRPATTPRQLVENLRDIFTRNYKTIPDEVAWVGGSFVHGKSIGGHIHFGGIRVTDEIKAALDGVVSQMVLLLEDVDGAKKRRSSAYGQLGDIREKKWGFEYRPLPSWIVSDNIALGVIALAKAVVLEELSQGPRSIRKLSRSDRETIIAVNIDAFRRCDKSVFYPKLETLFAHAMQLEYWRTDEGKDLTKHVAMLRYIAKTYPDWHTDKDILDRWRIRPTPPAYNFTRTTTKPVINLQEVLDLDTGWARIINGG